MLEISILSILQIGFAVADQKKRYKLATMQYVCGTLRPTLRIVHSAM